MFLILQNRLILRHIQKDAAFSGRRVAGHRLGAQIHGHASWSWSADDACEHERRGNEPRKVLETRAVPMVVQHARAGRKLHAGQIQVCKDWKCWSAAGDEAWNSKTFFQKALTECQDRLQQLLHRLVALNRTFLMIVTIVNLQAAGLDAGRGGDHFVQPGSILTWRNAGPVLSYVAIKEDRDLLL